MKEQKYTQCKLKKNNSYQMSWIPSQFAKVGKVLKLRVDCNWDDGWMVEAKSWKEVNEASQQYKHQRKASDI